MRRPNRRDKIKIQKSQKKSKKHLTSRWAFWFNRLALPPKGTKSRANCNRRFGWLDGAKNAKRNINKNYMKRKLGSILSSRNKKIVCTVSAAALMLGVSSAASVGLHFQENYSCTDVAYSGYPITVTAFGIPPSSWQNLSQMPNSYGSCGSFDGPWVAPGYTFIEDGIGSTNNTNGFTLVEDPSGTIVATNLTPGIYGIDGTKTNALGVFGGLNPLPDGASLNVTWFGNCANCSGFGGYEFSPAVPSPTAHYTYGGALNETNPKTTGEAEVYATFIRDGINYGQPTGGPNNTGLGYQIDVTGLASLFPSTPFVVELMASADSMNTITNAFIIDVDNSITNSVTYPATPPVQPEGGPTWLRGEGGGLSIASAPFTNIDHIHIMSAQAQHGGTNGTSVNYNNGGTISGFIITDKPVVSMSPQSVPLASVGDSVFLSAYAVGVPPLSYQWRFEGQTIPGATATNYTVTNLTLATLGGYDLVVTNLYGSTTSGVSSVGLGQVLTQAANSATNLIYDSNPDNPQHVGLNTGATWLASSTDSNSVTRTGVMSFGTFGATNAATNLITVADSPVFDSTTATITFWMQSAGTDTNDLGEVGAAIIERPTGSSGDEFVIMQDDSNGANGPALDVYGPDIAIYLTGAKTVSDNKWHFVALTYNQAANAGSALFIDGVLDVTNVNTGSWSAAGLPLDIGAGSDHYYRPYHGLLDAVQFYSTVLSLSQIQSIYSAGNSDALVDATNLQMQFNFTDGPQGGGLNLSWPQPSAILESAPTLTGPWVPVSSTSPYTIIPTETQQFFRYIYTNTPQTLISNPWLM
jgi:hypothetical protein